MTEMAPYDRQPRDRRQYAVFWVLKILSWPFRLLGAVGIGSSAPAVLFGSVNDPAMTQGIFRMLFGAGLFGFGYGISLFSNWLARKRFSPANLYFLGCRYVSLRPKVAIQFLSAALSADKRLIGVYYNRALCHVGLADKEALEALKKPHLDRAEKDLHDYLAAQTDRAEAYYVLGMIQKSRGNSSEARELLTKAAVCHKHDPTPTDAGIQPPSLEVIERSLATIK
jgi:hypothetical protein